MRLSSLPEPYRRLLAPVYAPSFFMALGHEALLILLPLYALELGHGAAFAALVVGMRGVGVLIFDVPAGVIAARFGDRPVLQIGVIAMLAGTLGLVLFDSKAAFVLSALLLGFGFAAWMLGRQSYVAEHCEAHEVGRAITVMAGIQRGGAFVGPALAGLTAAVYGFPAAFVVVACSTLVAGVFVQRFASAGNVESRAGNPGFSGLKRVLRDDAGRLATAGTAALALQLMRAARQILIPIFGQSVGLDVATISLVYSMSAALDMCLFYPVGLLVDRRGRKWSAVPAMLILAMGLSLLPWADALWSLIAVALLLGFANGLGTGIVMILGADLSRASAHRGQFLGIWRLISDIGMTSAPLLTSAMINIASLAAASLTVAGLGLAGTALMAFVVRETLIRPPQRDLRQD